MMYTIFNNKVESCDRCQRGNNKLKKAVGGLHPIPVKPQIFHQLGMDLIGPLPETAQGNKCIITLTDYFSKWAEAAPLPSKHAAGAAKFIYSVSIHVQTNNKNDEDHSLKTEPPSRLKQKVNHLLLVCMYVAPLVVMSAWLMA